MSLFHVVLICLSRNNNVASTYCFYCTIRTMPYKRKGRTRRYRKRYRRRTASRRNGGSQLATKAFVRRTCRKKIEVKRWSFTSEHGTRVPGLLYTAPMFQTLEKGTGTLNRIGRKITLIGWQLHMMCQNNNSTTVSYLRFMILKDKDASTTITTQLYAPLNSEYPFNHTGTADRRVLTYGLNKNKVDTMYNRVFRLQPKQNTNPGNNEIIFKTNIHKFKHPLVFESDGSGSPISIPIEDIDPKIYIAYTFQNQDDDTTLISQEIKYTLRFFFTDA